MSAVFVTLRRKTQSQQLFESFCIKPTAVGIFLSHPGVRVTSASFELFVNTDFEGVLNDKLISL